MSGKRIAVLGMSFPARVVGRELELEGHEVIYYGDDRGTGQFKRHGPRYLWLCNDVRLFFGPYVKLIPQRVEVKWWNGHEVTTRHTLEEVYAYNVKTRGRQRPHAPCEGQTNFLSVLGGWNLLDSRLKPRKSKGFAIAIFPTEIGWRVVNEGKKAEAVDGIVTSLHYQVFGKLTQYYRADFPRVGTRPIKVYYHYAREHTPDMGLPLLNANMLVYSGREEDPWFRWSYDGEVYILESRERLPGNWDLVESSVSKILDATSDLYYPEGVFPVGRWAEGKEDLLVHEVIERREKYVEQVERGLGLPA